MESNKCRHSLNMALLFVVTVICMLSLSYPAISQVDKHRLDTYIVHVRLPSGKDFSESESLEGFYHSFFPKTMTSLNKQSRMVYPYRNVVTGFAARLSQGEAKAMERNEGVLSVRQQRVYSLHTTHSPNFLGLHLNGGVWNGSNYGEGVIVGVLDTGITPGHPSFNDQGVHPPPAKWKGKCEFDGAVCNNKLIGARNFVTGDSGPPVDDEGHGTHTSSTATGNFVNNANVFGNAYGTAVGMAPLAHVAMYKVCGADCSEIDILAAMDAAVEDGVDILSLSLGGPSAPFFADSVAIGAFGAIQKGIFVSCSAGNSGPVSSSVSNEAPWILTVGASTIDRKIEATVLLGSAAFFGGESLFQPKDFANNSLLPLVFPGASGDQNVIWCAEGSLNKTEVEGKIVLCERGGGIARIAKGQAVKDAGGAAMILMNQEVEGYSTLADPHVLPASHVSYASGLTIKQYINSTSSPFATILFEGTVLGVDSAPAVTSFSSRGPSIATPGILKPDIIGPGVSILAAWPESVDNITSPNASFNMISGTSMSCPHLSGIAALLKSSHPTWSPAAIKSAIMTTANVVNLKKQPIVDERFLQADLFAIGAGHVNPDQANDPGLVYDLQPNDYIPYLCGLSYSDDQISVIVGHAVTCANTSTIPEAQLNYPSFSINLGTSVQEFSRVVTNVGNASSSYTVQISSPPGVKVSVTPSTLVFSEVNQQLTYDITFSRLSSAVAQTFVQGYLTWTSSKYAVRSPISVALE